MISHYFYNCNLNSAFDHYLGVDLKFVLANDST